MNISKIVDFHQKMLKDCPVTEQILQKLSDCMKTIITTSFERHILLIMWEKLRNLSSKITKLRGEYFKNHGFSPKNVKRRFCNCTNVAISLLLHENYHYYMFWEAYLAHMWEKLRNWAAKLWNLSSKIVKFEQQNCEIWAAKSQN